MSAPAAALRPAGSAPEASGAGQRLRWALSDTVTLTWRNLVRYVRIPETLFWSSVQPIMFVLLFRYVFGGAIRTGGVSYVNFLIPGIFIQTIAFGAVNTAIGLAEDLQKGIIERFRALPMARAAVLTGRTLADLARALVVSGIIMGVGYAVGFRAQTSPAAVLAGVGLLLLFSYALSWGFAVVGLVAPNSETAQVMAFPVLFPLTFASSAFVPVATMPHWLHGFADYQPVSVVCDAVRALMIGGPTSTSLWRAIAWALGIVAVLAPVAVRRYRRLDR